MRACKVLYINSPKYDLITALHIEGLQSVPGVELRCTTLGNYARPADVLNRRDAIAYGNDEADAVILGSRPYVDEGIFRSIKAGDRIRVRMEGGDESALGIRFRDFLAYDFIFKRELYLQDCSLEALWCSLVPHHAGLWERLRGHPLMPFPFFHSLANQNRWYHLPHNMMLHCIKSRVHPFPMGLEIRFQGELNPDPEFELACIMTPHLPERLELMEMLKKKNYPRTFIGTIPSEDKDIRWMVERGACQPDAVHLGGVGLAHNARYYEQVRNSRACISVPGGGFDTLRFWEILGMGSLLISKRVTLQMPQPLVEGEHYVAFDTVDEFNDIVDWLYRRPEEADRIRCKGHEYAFRHHTSHARAKYFLGVLGLQGEHD